MITNKKLAEYLTIAMKQQKRQLETLKSQFGAEVAETGERNIAELESLILDLQRAHPEAPQMASTNLSLMPPQDKPASTAPDKK